MTASLKSNPLGICSWSVHPKGPEELVEGLKALGLDCVQLALGPFQGKGWSVSETASLMEKAGIRMVSGMFGCKGEDYSTLESIRRTGGVVPDETWPATWEIAQRAAGTAAELRIPLVTFHAGFLPEDPDSPSFSRLSGRLSRVAALFGGRGIDVAFETGQEPAESLLRFLDAVDNPRIGVNFDPANMILYDSGDPVAALRMLAPHLKQCHVKDATRTEVPGTWGKEVPVGEGEVDWDAFFGALAEAEFAGPLVVEREAGEDRMADIGRALALVREKMANTWSA